MATLTHGTWVLIADGEKALFLRNDLDEINPDLTVVRIEEQENPADARSKLLTLSEDLRRKLDAFFDLVIGQMQKPSKQIDNMQ